MDISTYYEDTDAACVGNNHKARWIPSEVRQILNADLAAGVE